MTRLRDRLLPPHLGPNFHLLWLSATVSNTADGVLLAAGPLLVASITREPFAVAMGVFVQRLPWLLFGVMAGALIDRMDRRRLMVVVDLCRAGAIGALALAVATGSANLPVIYAALFLLGTAETFADNAGGVLVAVTVPKEAIGQATARMYGSAMVTNQLAGPPLGALLFGVSLALPFSTAAACFLVAAAFVARVRLPPETDEPPARRSLRAEVLEGVRWLWGNPPVRTLALMITIFNITFGAAFSVWVLYAYERLQVGEVGFGLLMSAGAVGGLVGAAVFRFLEQRFSYALLLRVGLIIETLTHASLALTRRPAVALLIMTVFGIHAVVWGTTSTTIRQRAVPSRLLGRVSSVYLIGGIGALALGTLLGGAIAQRGGVLAPFWFAAGGSALTTALIWRSLTNVAHAGEGDGDDTIAARPI